MSRYDDEVDERIVIDGRPDFGNWDFGITEAKRFPPYIYSTTGNSCLIHKIARVELRWWRPSYNKMYRLKRPVMIAETVCGQHKFLNSKKAKMCVLPSPDAVLCGRCHGEVATFGSDGAGTKAGITRRQAHAKLGCIVEGE